MLTFIGKVDLTCITKEKADLLSQGVQRRFETDQFPPHRCNFEMSLGDDLEELIDDIKTNDTRIFYNRRWDRNFTFRELFQISTLTKDDQKKLESKDSSFENLFAAEKPDVPKAQMDLSESTTKYRLSVAKRRTDLIVDCLKKCPAFKKPIQIRCRGKCEFCDQPFIKTTQRIYIRCGSTICFP